jgi:hypothetical protein
MDVALSATKARRKRSVATDILRTEMLRHAPLANIGTMLQCFACKEARRLFPGSVETQDPAQLTAAEAATIGEGITVIRLGHMVPERALAEIFHTYPVLRATADQCVWFEPMLRVMLVRQMEDSKSSTMRLVWSTTLSLLDVGTDLYAVIIFYQTNDSVSGSLILAMVILSIAAQLLIVFLRNKHRSFGEIARELLIVLSFFKPVVDSRRLLVGYEVDGAPFNTATERTMMKIIESVCESLPSSLISAIALAWSAEWAWAPVVSVLMSWLVTALKIVSLSFNLDMDRANRHTNPQFFGYVPDGLWHQNFVWACLFLLILAHVAGRTIAMALLFVTNKAWLGGFIGVDMGTYLLYKAMRRDIIVWIPGMGIGGSIVYRSLAKLMLDMSGMPQLRHPKDNGGAYWAWSMIMCQLVCMMSGWLYLEFYGGLYKLDRTLVFGTIGGLAITWMISLAGFFVSIRREYLWTFISHETGRAFQIRFFHEAEGNDEKRFNIFLNNRGLWEEIRPEVKAWSLANYDRWKADKPVWLTPGLFSKIPDDFVPKVKATIGAGAT